jgi:hypothetical protein
LFSNVQLMSVFHVFDETIQVITSVIVASGTSAKRKFGLVESSTSDEPPGTYTGSNEDLNYNIKALTFGCEECRQGKRDGPDPVQHVGQLPS